MRGIVDFITSKEAKSMIKVRGNEIFIKTQSGNIVRIELRKVDGASEYHGENPLDQRFNPWPGILKELSQN